MSILLDGTLGITSPAETVQGNLTTTGNTILGNASTDTLNVGNGGLVKDASSNLILSNPTSQALNAGLYNLQLSTSSGYVIDTGPTFGLYAAVPSSSNWPIAIISARADGTSYGGYLQFTTTPSGGSPLERMRISSSGNVGIGPSASPVASLQVSKQTALLSGTGNAFGVYVYPTSSGACYIDALTSVTGITDLSLRTYNNGTYNSFIKTESGGTATSFQVGGTERMRIDSSGNLLFNSGYGSVATAYGCRAWVNFNGTASGTFAGGASTVTRIAASTTATITTTTPHLLTTGNSVWALTGVVAGAYTVTVLTTTTFTITTVATTALTAVAITFAVNSIRASGNVSSITDNGTGNYTVNFTTAMPDVNYSVFGMGMLNRRVQYASATFGTGLQAVGAVNILNTDSSTTATDDQCVNVCVFR